MLEISPGPPAVKKWPLLPENCLVVVWGALPCSIDSRWLSVPRQAEGPSPTGVCFAEAAGALRQGFETAKSIPPEASSQRSFPISHMPTGEHCPPHLYPRDQGELSAHSQRHRVQDLALQFCTAPSLAHLPWPDTVRVGASEALPPGLPGVLQELSLPPVTYNTTDKLAAPRTC